MVFKNWILWRGKKYGQHEPHKWTWNWVERFWCWRSSQTDGIRWWIPTEWSWGCESEKAKTSSSNSCWEETSHFVNCWHVLLRLSTQESNPLEEHSFGSVNSRVYHGYLNSFCRLKLQKFDTPPRFKEISLHFLKERTSDYFRFEGMNYEQISFREESISDFLEAWMQNTPTSLFNQLCKSFLLMQ